MSKAKRAATIRILLPNGTADGLKIVEKLNWSGRGLVCPRSIFPESKKQDDFSRIGVYILIGPSESTDLLPVVYVGQGDPVRSRLEKHYANKEFWTRCVFFVSKVDHLNKAHIQYLESKLIGLAKDAKRCTLDNANNPALPSMSEMDIADADGFLHELLLCVSVIGLDFFTKPSRPDEFCSTELVLQGKYAMARGYESAEGLVVLADGLACKENYPTATASLLALRKSLVDNGVLLEDGDYYRLTQDYTFHSPTQAASVMMGRPASGPGNWMNSMGQTLKQIREASIHEPSGGGTT